MSAALVTRLFALVGQRPPSGPAARAFARAPRERLVRAVAWYALAPPTTRLGPAAQLLPSLRLIIRGWDDVYTASTVPRDARVASVETPRPGHALVIRHGRAGRGWSKEALPTLGAVREEIELAARWLSREVGCIVHDDCAATPELGAACAASEPG